MVFQGDPVPGLVAGTYLRHLMRGILIEVLELVYIVFLSSPARSQYSVLIQIRLTIN